MDILSGNIVRINLTNGKTETEPSRPYLSLFPGGRGLNQYLLFKEVKPGTAPFDRANVVIFGAGLLAGTAAPGACRLSIDSLSAFTGGVGSSNCGGYFAPELRFAGIDHVVVKGRSKTPVYLWIHDDHIELRDASHLWGMTTSQTEDALREDLGDPRVQVLSIGPAGERLARPACIVVNKARVAGRCGLGAVMGSKNLKAIAVQGTGGIEVRHPRELEQAVMRMVEKLKANEFNKLRMHYGVYCYQPWTSESPYRNFQGGRVPGIEETRAVSPDAFLRYKRGSKGCYSCPIKCWGLYEFTDGAETVTCEALQGNDPHNFGAKLNLFDAKDILKAHALCNDLGLDTDNACGVLAWAFECYEKGLLTSSDTDGLSLEWGNREAVFELLRKVAYRDGPGDVLAEGSMRASQILGGTEYSIHIKGQDLMESLRSSVGWALGTVVAARGGTHTRGAVKEERLRDAPKELVERVFGIPAIGEVTRYDNKERLVHFFERLEAMLDCLGICEFTNSLRIDMLMPEDFAELVRWATGFQMDEAQFMALGERVHTLERCLNVLYRGWTRTHDYPPRRFMAEPIVNGPLAGTRLDEQEWGKLLDRYYALHGWDAQTGWPTRETLDELGLSEVADKLGEWNRLP